MQQDQPRTETQIIHLPAPTQWPLMLALGLSLVLAGMVTHWVVSVLGAVLTVVGSIGWFFQVFPNEVVENFAVKAIAIPVSSARGLHIHEHEASTHRQIIPIESFHITTGIKGGVAGGLAMMAPAALFGLLRFHSIWYAANLLAAGGFVSWAGASDAYLSQFHLRGLIAALIIHGVTSILVGLLYGAMLPMYPKYPIITAGIMVPLLFTGILHTALGFVSPILNLRIDWFWFVASQLAFGLVCGFVVNLNAKVRTPQFRALPFSVRAGLHDDRRERGPNETTDEKDKPE
jgi:hypothetical protein